MRRFCSEIRSCAGPLLIIRNCNRGKQDPRNESGMNGKRSRKSVFQTHNFAVSQRCTMIKFRSIISRNGIRIRIGFNIARRLRDSQLRWIGVLMQSSARRPRSKCAGDCERRKNCNYRRRLERRKTERIGIHRS